MKSALHLFLLVVIYCYRLVLPLAWGIRNARRTHSSPRTTTTTSVSSSTSMKENEYTVEPPPSFTSEEEVNGVLASLFGSVEARDKFFSQDLGVNVIHRRRTDLDLPSSLPDFSMQDIYHSNEYIQLRQRGSLDMLNKTKMSTFSSFEDYIQDGGSAVVPVVDDAHLSTFKDRIQACLGYDTSMNIYHSGPRGVALNRHYDTYDVIVVQMEGEKEWEIKVPDNTDKDVLTWTNTTMIPGDLLYIPQGVFHAATTAAGFSCSTHITIGLLPPPPP